MYWDASSMGMGLLAAAAFGLLGIFLTLAGYKIFDWITPQIEVQKELAEKHNVAVAIVVGSVIIGIAMVVAASIAG